MHGVRNPVQREPLHHPGQAQTVIAVEVRDAHTRQRRGGNTGTEHLLLGALTRVEQDRLVVPAQHVAVLVPFPRGDLAGSTQHDQLSHQMTPGSGDAAVVRLQVRPERRVGRHATTAQPWSHTFAGLR